MSAVMETLLQMHLMVKINQIHTFSIILIMINYFNYDQLLFDQPH